ncbi:MAG: GDP-mannose dehydrogenase [Crenarchaeota archaeon]|nr:GDP-mannose dehydrogenase [Thermoproteota archaeon]
MREKVLVAGLGEVGSALYEIIKDSNRYELYGYDIDPRRTVNKLEDIPERVDYIHICVPFKDTEHFVKVVGQYIDRYLPDFVIIHSTVAPGTTREIYKAKGVPVAFSPVRGKHPFLKSHMLFWPKWVCALPREYTEVFVEHLKSVKLNAKGYYGEPETLELAKIFETTYRALLIAWWQEMHRIARHFNADILAIAEFIGEIHEKLKDKPPMFPGVIGGHCLIPNTEILYRVYKSKFLEAILESNAKRADEIKDPSIREEVSKLQEFVKKYIVLEYYEGKV